MYCLPASGHRRWLIGALLSALLGAVLFAPGRHAFAEVSAWQQDAGVFCRAGGDPDAPARSGHCHCALCLCVTHGGALPTPVGLALASPPQRARAPRAAKPAAPPLRPLPLPRARGPPARA